MSEMIGLLAKTPLNTSPTAPSTPQAAVCHLRSPVRSECLPMRIMPTQATAIGNGGDNAVRQDSRVTPRSLMICGSQKDTP